MDDTIFIYRVEKENGDGPYFTPDSPLYRSVSTDHQPVPGWDDITITVEDHCGFKNVKQFNDWFSLNEVRLLSDHGYRCNTYSVPIEDVKFGKKQVAFKKQRAEIVSITELIELKEVAKYGVLV